jgi:uncharacterized membrane protein YczE
MKTNDILDISSAGRNAGGMTLRALARLLAAHPVVGAGIALVLRSELGAAPWEVFHAGLAHTTGLSVGTAAGATAIAAIALAAAAGVRPGLATLINAVLLGVCIDAALAVLPAAGSLAAASGYLAAGIAALALGTGLYMSAGLGSGPRDSLMVAVARTCRWSTARARAILELTAVIAGVLLGGRAGAGTLIYAAAIGPAAQWSIQLFAEDPA